MSTDYARRRPSGTSTPAAIDSVTVGVLEQLDQVPGRVSNQDLAPSGACDHLAAKRLAGVAEPLDFGIEVLQDEMDTVAARFGAVARRGAGAGAGGAGEQQA